MLDIQSIGWGSDEVTYFSVGDIFCKHLGTTYANFEYKIFPETSGKKFQTFHCSKITTMKSNFFPDISGKIFSWNRHTKSQGIYKKRPQHRSMWLHSCSVQNSVYQASHCSALLIGWLDTCPLVYLSNLRNCWGVRHKMKNFRVVPNLEILTVLLNPL